MLYWRRWPRSSSWYSAVAIKVLAIGKKHESWVQEGIERYQKRLAKPYDIEWQLLPHSSLVDASARQEEAGRILAKLDTSSYVILLDEVGKNISSPQLAELCSAQFVHSRSITIIIGGAYGVTDELRHGVDFVWSLSNLVFPHQLVRLMLTEQLYRAQEIAAGGKYHHV